MSLILDETFASGIPGGFATLRQQSGSPTATYNSGAQAVDLVMPTAALAMWDITSQSVLASGEAEIDLEFIADSGSLRRAGLWGVAGAAAVSNGFRASHDGSLWQSEAWTGAVSWAGNGTATQITQDGAAGGGVAGGGLGVFNTAGDRRVLNLRWDLSAGAGVSRAAYEVRLDGALITRTLATSGHASLRPAIFFYQDSVRLHSIKVWDAPQAALTPITYRGLLPKLGRLVMAPAEALLPGSPGGRYRGLTLGRRDQYFGGKGRVQGTTKEKHLPSNIPLKRRVQLIDEATRLLIREMWSDATTGAYSFDYVDMARVYSVTAYDHTDAYRAVIANGQIPELIP